eukprot:g1170.t1
MSAADAAIEGASGNAGGNTLLNFDQQDAFEEANAAAQGGSGSKVHVRIQARNRRKCVLTIQGLDDDLDLKKICKYMRRNLQCNGAIVKDDTFGEVIQLQGDHRQAVRDFLVDMEICQASQLIIHGELFIYFCRRVLGRTFSLAMLSQQEQEQEQEQEQFASLRMVLVVMVIHSDGY